MSDILSASIHGIFLALGLIIPLGVQNIFIFNQGATQKTILSFMPSVITAAVCDTLLITASVCGISLLVLELSWLKLGIFIVGIIFLIYMGFITWNSSFNLDQKSIEPISAKKQILFAASVSILNPHAIIDAIAVIGTSSLHYHGYAKISYSLSCILVSWIWFFALALAGHNLKKIDQDGRYMQFVNKLAAIIIWIVALYLGVQIL